MLRFQIWRALQWEASSELKEQACFIELIKVKVIQMTSWICVGKNMLSNMIDVRKWEGEKWTKQLGIIGVYVHFYVWCNDAAYFVSLGCILKVVGSHGRVLS